MIVLVHAWRLHMLPCFAVVQISKPIFKFVVCLGVKHAAVLHACCRTSASLNLCRSCQSLAQAPLW